MSYFLKRPVPLLYEEVNILPADGTGMRRKQHVWLFPQGRSGRKRLFGKNIQSSPRKGTVFEGADQIFLPITVSASQVIQVGTRLHGSEMPFRNNAIRLRPT